MICSWLEYTIEILAKFHNKVKDCATVDARGYVIIMLSARYFERNSVGCFDCIYWRGLLALPSDFIRAMREASDCRTVTDTDSYAFFVNQSNANEGKTEATIIHMQREIRLCFDAKLLSSDEGALARAKELLVELENRGFLKDGLVIFDSTQEEEVNEIFDRHIFLGNLPQNYNL